MTSIRFLEELEDIIRSRLREMPEGSYTAEVARRGLPYAARKLGEEAVELIVELLSGDDRRVVEEAADLLYFLILTLNMRGLSLADVAAELEERHRRVRGEDGGR